MTGTRRSSEKRAIAARCCDHQGVGVHHERFGARGSVAASGASICGAFVTG